MGKGNETAAIILVVEDVEEVRDGIENLLKSDGYGVEPARDEEDAVRRASRRRPGLILVSLAGRHADLVATGRRIRNRSELNTEVPVVIFGSATVAEGTEMAIGESTFITHPDNFDQLRLFVRQLLQAPSAAQ